MGGTGRKGKDMDEDMKMQRSACGEGAATGTGSACLAGPYKELVHIDKDHLKVYRRDDPTGGFETRLLSQLTDEELIGEGWAYDEWSSNEEETAILTSFTVHLMGEFHNFERPPKVTWIGPHSSRYVLLEDDLFYVAVDEDERSLAVGLFPKERPSAPDLSEIQEEHYQRCVESMKKILTRLLPSVRTGRPAADTTDDGKDN